MTLMRPLRSATSDDFEDFVTEWIRRAAAKGFDAAVAVLDSAAPLAGPRSCSMNSPLNGRGWAVDHDLPMDGKRSDFTVQMAFLKTDEGYSVHLRDIHVL